MQPNSQNSNPGHSTDSFKTSVDVAQWRQDVDAFTSATRQMLESVHQELSSGLASGQAQVNIVRHEQPIENPVELPSPVPVQKEHADQSNRSSDDVDQSNRSPEDADQSNRSPDDADQLLAKLKERLAQQLNQH